MLSKEYFLNGLRYRKKNNGWYESWFLRANHPYETKAFWIRYTIFSECSGLNDAFGELWAAYFDAEKQKVFKVYESIPLEECHFVSNVFGGKISNAILGKGFLCGSASVQSETIGWNMRYSALAPNNSVLPLKSWLYHLPIPKAKLYVGESNCTFRGQLSVDGCPINVSGWRGSENHNWGSEHTYKYAWGQVVGFDHDCGVFLECYTAQLKIAGVKTPFLSGVCIRTSEKEIYLNSPIHMVTATSEITAERWIIKSSTKNVCIYIEFTMPKDLVARFDYRNPRGGIKKCVNSKVAECKLEIREKGRPPNVYKTSNRAAFEILS